MYEFNTYILYIHKLNYRKIIFVFIKFIRNNRVVFFINKEIITMVKKRKSVLKSSSQVVDSPMKEPRIISKYKNDFDFE